MEPEVKPQEQQEDYDPLLDKIPARYIDLYDSEDFEKFTYRKDWYD